MVALFQECGLLHQEAFRTILDATSRPGTIQALPSPPCDAGDPWPYLSIFLETLLDQEVSHYILPGNGTGEIEDRLYQQTRSPCVSLAHADFIIAPDGSTKGAIAHGKRGDPFYPDQSATVIYCVRNIGNVALPSRRYRISGPGIDGSLWLPPLDEFDWSDLECLRAVNTAFPSGIDAFFIDDAGRLLGLPRSTQISPEVA